MYEEKYEQYLQESNVQKVDKKMERELMKMEEKKTDDMFERFKKRIKREPKQVRKGFLKSIPQIFYGQNVK